MTRITEEKVQNYCENIVIGNGIMAKQLMFALKDHYSDISCISSLDFAPASSLSTTSINCLRGTEKGVSVLGDLLVESQIEFINFYKKFNPPGVSKTVEVQTWLEGGNTHAKWLRRYGSYELVSNLRFSKSRLLNPLACVEVEAYVIDTNIFFKWYDQHLININFIHDFVVNVIKNESGYSVFCKSGKVYNCTRLFMCTSYMSSQFLSLCSDDKDRSELSKHKKTYGSYLAYDLNNEDSYDLDFSVSFSLSYNFSRLIYRKQSNQLLFSLNDVSKNSFVSDQNILLGIYDEFKKALNLLQLPCFSKWSLMQGIRAKGSRRIPFCKEVNSNLFICSGLYKNAFSFSYLFSKQILKTLNK